MRFDWCWGFCWCWSCLFVKNMSCLVWFGVDFFGTEHVVFFGLFNRSIVTKSEHVLF